MGGPKVVGVRIWLVGQMAGIRMHPGVGSAEPYFVAANLRLIRWLLVSIRPQGIIIIFGARKWGRTEPFMAATHGNKMLFAGEIG